jgi:hypothetical protein
MLRHRGSSGGGVANEKTGSTNDTSGKKSSEDKTIQLFNWFLTVLLLNCFTINFTDNTVACV